MSDQELDLDDAGYNPEVVKGVLGTPGALTVSLGGVVYRRTSCLNVLQYVLKHPRELGLIFHGFYYAEVSHA